MNKLLVIENIKADAIPPEMDQARRLRRIWSDASVRSLVLE